MTELAELNYFTGSTDSGLHASPRFGNPFLDSVVTGTALWTVTGYGMTPQSAAATPWTFGRVVVGPNMTSAPLSVAERVRTLKERSGLSWKQIAALFGVTRRAVHFWLEGGNITDHHIERLEDLDCTLTALDSGDPVSTRSVILTPDATGVSTYARLVRAVSGPRRVRRVAAEVQGDEELVAPYIAGEALGTVPINPSLYQR